VSELSSAAAYILLIVVPVACFWKRYGQRRSMRASLEQPNHEPFGADACDVRLKEKATSIVVRVPK
jgi:hypothetical protein